MSANEANPSHETNHNRSNGNSFDEQTKLRFAHEIVEAINQCLVNKMNKTASTDSALLVASGHSSHTDQHNECTDTEQDATEKSVREFKRLGAYCTLRPEQRRKHLLKVLPTLRRSNILQALLVSNSSSESGGDVNDILMNLDRFIECGGNISSVSENINNNNSLANSCEATTSNIHVDPEKIEDCLKELDVYLEEIDRDYGKTLALSSINSVNRSSKCALDAKMNASACSENINLLDGIEHDETSDDENSSIGFRTSETKQNECDNRNNLLHTVEVNEESVRQRGAEVESLNLWQEIDGNITTPTASSSGANAMTQSRQQMQWRRSSMRKTKPISLPRTNVEAETTSSSAPIQSLSLPPLPSSSSHTETLVDLFDTSPNQTNETASVEASQQETERQTTEDASNGGSSSLDSEFLNMILSPIETETIETTTTPLSPRLVAAENVSMPNESNRPRQMGRRSEARSRIVSITAERSPTGNQCIIVNCGIDNNTNSSIRLPASRSTALPLNNQAQLETSVQRTINESHSNASEFSSGCSSRNPSPVSLVSSSESSSGASTNVGNNIQVTTTQRTMNNVSDNYRSSSSTTNGRQTANVDAERRDSTGTKYEKWPSSIGRMFAALSCTLGLFNISRFSIFSIVFGANFLVQFLILSLLFGIPMLWLQMCLGSNIRRGPISMWRISPICRGIGIALVFVQAVISVYSSVSLSWLLVYMRDASISSRYPWYKWQEVYEFFRGPTDDGVVMMSNVTEPNSSSARLGETVADYFNGVVLERHHLGPGGSIGRNGLGGVRFQLAFNVTIVWLIVFITQCKSVRSHGKLIFAFTAVPLIGLVAVCLKLLTLLRMSSISNIFSSTNWNDFFANPQSWISAAQETFLTWTLLGASIVSIFSRSTDSSASHQTNLRRDAIAVVILTLFGLFLAAIFGNCCVQILNDRGFYYFPGSYETISSSIFLLPSNKPQSSEFATSLSKWLPRYSTVLGENMRRHEPLTSESGWQAIRLVTEIFPAALAAATHNRISSLWSLIAFCTFLFFGIGQLSIMWKPVISSLGSYSQSKSTMTTTTLLTCLIGCFLAIPLVTENGINVIHFMDVVVGGAWFVLLLWTVQVLAVFLVRGRPYTGDIIVNDLKLTTTLSAFIALSWNLLLPIGLLTLCVLEYRLSQAHDFYRWNSFIASYWPLYGRTIAAIMQIGIFQIVPLTAVIQSYRYLTKGPPDILDRFQLLYRPPMEASRRSSPRRRGSRPTPLNNETRTATRIPAIVTETAILDSTVSSLTIEDAPPKYTPPPSYTTATGSRIAKMLRNSIRRSVRRIMGEPSGNNRRQALSNVLNIVESSFVGEHPPAYTTIARPISARPALSISVNATTESNARPQNNRRSHRRHTTTTFPSPQKKEKIESYSSSTIPRRPSSLTSANAFDQRNDTLTAHDVARLLRSTAPIIEPPIESIPTNNFTRQLSNSNEDNSLNDCVDMIDEQCKLDQNYSLTQSVEQLLLNEMPIGESTAVATYVNDTTTTTATATTTTADNRNNQHNDNDS